MKLNKIKDEYRDKKVKIVDIDDEEFKGDVVTIEIDLETDNLDTYIGIKGEEGIISFYENEIQTIEIIK